MKENNISSLREMLEQMSTDQLDEMLDRELHNEPADEAAVRMILAVLKEREKDYQVEISPDVRRAWERIQRQRENKTNVLKLPSWAMRVASAVLVVGMLAMFIPQEGRAESFWERLTRWTDSIIEFFSPEDNSGRISEYEFITDNPGLQQVHDAVIEMGITEPVVPMWFPDGYEIIECKTIDTSRSLSLSANFSDGNAQLVFRVDQRKEDAARQFYFDEDQVSQLEIHGTNFSIVSNFDTWTVFWSQEEIECFLSADCQEDTIFKILMSIYEWEDE